MDHDWVLYDMSYCNLIMYNTVIPSYSSKKDKKGAAGNKINADDPRNSDEILKILSGK